MDGWMVGWGTDKLLWPRTNSHTQPFVTAPISSIKLVQPSQFVRPWNRFQFCHLWPTVIQKQFSTVSDIKRVKKNMSNCLAVGTTNLYTWGQSQSTSDSWAFNLAPVRTLSSTRDNTQSLYYEDTWNNFYIKQKKMISLI